MLASVSFMQSSIENSIYFSHALQNLNVVNFLIFLKGSNKYKFNENYAEYAFSLLLFMHGKGIILPVTREITLLKIFKKDIILEANQECVNGLFH